jgi:prepilin-type N-terminal cleavage/methylation domain-containing protein
MSKNKAGFTLPELIVAMAILTLLSIAIVSSVLGWLNQYAVGSARQTMVIDLQASLSKISDDVRQSKSVLPANIEPDASAPSGPTKWQTSSNQLVIGKTPIRTDGTAIYTIPTSFSGKSDSIVYYLNGTTLYRRVVPANYVGENAALPLVTCSVTATGGCPTDTRILSNVTSLQFTYYDALNASGAAPANTKSVMVDITTTKQQSGQTVTVKDKVRINPQALAVIVPPDDEDDTTPGPGVIQTTAGLVAGPGGLQTSFSNIAGKSMYIKGRLTQSNMGDINLTTNRLDVGNIGCGLAASTFPATCSPGQQPITTSFLSKIRATPICAPGQTVTTGLTGLAGCSLPAGPTPPFNKTNFTGSVTAGPASINCTILSGTVNMAANTRIDGSVTGSFCNKLSVGGNIYIRGNLTLGNNSILQVANGVTVRPIIVVNGQVSINFSQIRANSAGVTPYIISFYSSDSSCSNSNTTCAITNPQLYSSITTSPAAINVSTYSRVNASLYSFFGILNISGGTVTGALAGQRISITNLSAIKIADGKWPS